MKTYTLFILYLFLLSSCASRLNVKVSTADRDEILDVSNKYLKEEILPTLLTLEKFNNIIWNHEENLNKIYSYIEGKLSKPGFSPKLTDDLKKEYESAYYLKINSKLKSIKLLTKEARANYNDTITHKNTYVVQAFEATNKALLELQDVLSILENYEIKYIGFVNVIPKEVEDIHETLKIIKPRTRFPILGDPMASFITKKENKKIWKSTFNRTASWNLLGNADIAFILRSSPPVNEEKSGDYNNNFAIKGVRLDNADLTNNLVTGLTQTISFLASTQGVPILTKQPTTNKPLPIQDPLLLNLDANRQSLEDKKKKLNDYKKMLIQKIGIENIDGKNNATSAKELDKALARIEEFWNKTNEELKK